MRALGPAVHAAAVCPNGFDGSAESGAPGRPRPRSREARVVTWHGPCCARPPMASRALEQRRRRRTRGAAMVEYLVVLIAVVIANVGAAIACYEALYGWYTHFVTTVSKPGP